MNRNIAVTSGALVLCMLAVATWTTLRIPDGALVAIHFDPAGNPNQWMSAWPGLFILPGVTIVLAALLSILPSTGSWGEALQGSKAYETIALAIVVAMALTECLIIAIAAGFTANAVQFITALLGGLFVVLGNLLGKVRRNMWVGIRVPWTLADDENWDKTNRYAGKLMVIVGIVMFAAAFMIPELYAVAVIILATALITILPVFRSYKLSREQHR